MIKELVQFTQAALADEAFRDLNMAPKEGLHIVLQIENKEGQIKISDKADYVVYSKKTKEVTPLHLKCTGWWKASTMLGIVDTYKVFDLPAKAIHTVSPYCMGVKRTNLEGGKQYAENELKGKSQIHDRINEYFFKTFDLLESEEDKMIADAFRVALNDKTRLNGWLNASNLFKEIKDDEYVIFYLDLSIDQFQTASRKYLKEKLFNTADYNLPDKADSELLYGTSNWLNSFPTKKPFLKHQSATFDIAGRISSKEATLLQEFSDMARRKLFPNPLPLFIMQGELGEAAFKIYKEDAASGADHRKGYLEIMEELWTEFKRDLGNYYLLFISSKGEIKDFDFVSRFEYYLNADESQWKVEDLFGTGGTRLHTVRDLLTQVLPPLFNNSLVVRRKEKEWVFRWFDEIDPSYCKTYNAFLMAMKYRKAFYDFCINQNGKGYGSCHFRYSYDRNQRRCSS
ncbi:MAG: hypothetical protein IPH16_13210 [Haliscomenobacter sp.]|nr:hypothetical protein [Haliscomenobacter sp.]